MVKQWSFGLILLLLISAVSAADSFVVTHKDIRSAITLSESAIINVSISNLQHKDATYILDSPNVPEWDFSTDPRENYIVTVPAGDTRVITVNMRPLYAAIASYRLLIDVKDKDTEERQRIVVPVEVLRERPDTGLYKPDLRVNASISTLEVDPRQPLTIHVILRNNNPVPLGNVNLLVSSKTTEKRLTLDFTSRQEKAEDVVFQFSPFETPKDDEVHVVASVVQQNETFTWEVAAIPFTIIPYAELEPHRTTLSGFLRTTTTLSFANHGNTERSTLVREEISPLRAIFTRTDPAAVVKWEKGKIVYYWNVNLRAEKADNLDTVTITIAQSYTILIFIAVAGILAILLYYRYRSPIVIRKGIAEIHKSEESSGGIHRMKVIIHLKNRTKKSFEQIRVVDPIPNITEIEGDFAVGTLKPTKVITKQNKSTLVIWEIPAIEPLEERIITYQLKSSLHIVGGIVLPPTKVKFKDARGAMSTKFSNRTDFKEGP